MVLLVMVKGLKRIILEDEKKVYGSLSMPTREHPTEEALNNQMERILKLSFTNPVNRARITGKKAIYPWVSSSEAALTISTGSYSSC
jgi:hypothetical protein